MLLLFLSSGDYDQNAELPGDIRKIVDRCTELYPNRRYANAAALQRVLLGRRTAAKVGFAALFASAGAATALAVTLCLPKPAPELIDDVPVNALAESVSADVSEDSQPVITDPSIIEASTPTTDPAKTEATSTAATPEETEATPPTPVISPDGSVVFAEPRIERAVRLHLGLSDSDPIGEEELKRVTSIVL